MGSSPWNRRSARGSHLGGLLLAQHEVIDAAWGELLNAALENPPEECLGIGPNGLGGVPRPSSFSDAVTRADAIIYGVVTGIAGGFGARPEQQSQIVNLKL